MNNVLQFTFAGDCDRDSVESDIALAIFTAECVYGRPRVRMEAAYDVDGNGVACVLNVSGEAGDAVARVFAGLTAARVGETAYSVRRIQGSGVDELSDAAEVGA